MLVARAGFLSGKIEVVQGTWMLTLFQVNQAVLLVMPDVCPSSLNSCLLESDAGSQR